MYDYESYLHKWKTRKSNLHYKLNKFIIYSHRGILRKNASQGKHSKISIQGDYFLIEIFAH